MNKDVLLTLESCSAIGSHSFGIINPSVSCIASGTACLLRTELPEELEIKKLYQKLLQMRDLGLEISDMYMKIETAVAKEMNQEESRLDDIFSEIEDEGDV